MRALVLTTSATTNLQDVVSSVDAHGLTPDQITLATHSAALPAGALGAGYDLILSVAAEPGHHTVPRLGALAAALRPGGLLVVKQTAEVRAAAWRVGATGQCAQGWRPCLDVNTVQECAAGQGCTLCAASCLAAVACRCLLRCSPMP